jgi:amino acid transporter
VLGRNVSRVPDPEVNFRDSFAGTTTNGNDLANALVNIVFSYTGYQNAFNVVNEIKNPIPTLKRNVSISVGIVATLYMLCNVAYFSAGTTSWHLTSSSASADNGSKTVQKAEFAKSKEIAAAVFFTAVFGKGRAETALNVLVLLSAFGNLLATLIGQSRMIREIGR